MPSELVRSGEVILVVAAHPDDEILGVGGTVRRLVDQGARAFALILGEGATARTDLREGTAAAAVEQLHRCSLAASQHVGYSQVSFAGFPDNRFDSVDLLEVIKSVERLVRELKPQLVLTHHHGDLNIDHRITCEAVLTATRPLPGNLVRTVACFETLSSTEWAFAAGYVPFRANLFVDIGRRGMDAKLAAMGCYESELCAPPHPRSNSIIEAASRLRGSTAGVEWAEGFEILRTVV